MLRGIVKVRRVVCPGHIGDNGGGMVAKVSNVWARCHQVSLQKESITWPNLTSVLYLELSLVFFLGDMSFFNFLCFLFGQKNPDYFLGFYKIFSTLLGITTILVLQISCSLLYSIQDLRSVDYPRTSFFQCNKSFKMVLLTRYLCFTMCYKPVTNRLIT